METTGPQNVRISESAGASAWFRTTHWSSVLHAADSGSERGGVALSDLCHTYWHPLYAYVRRSGYSPEDAKDLTQEFFGRLIHKDYLKAVKRDKGKFRSFLLMALKRFLANEWDKANRLKRGGGQEVVSFDAQDTEDRFVSEPAHDSSPEKAFDRRWAMTLLEQVMGQLEAESQAAGNGHLFGELKALLGGDKSETSYAELAQKLSLNEGALRVCVHRLRQRYRELLRLEIAQTVETPEAVDDEIRHLFAALA